MIEFSFKKIAVIAVCAVITMSCNQKHKEMDTVKIAENYVSALNTSDYKELVELFLDSIRFNEMDHVRAFSKEGYRSLFQWDSVFRPKYKILDINKSGDSLELKVSKACDRILFLQEEPFVSREIMKIKNGKIYSIDIVEYVDFKDSLWADRRENLVSWIAEHHPELDGFIYDQTKEGAVKFQKAIAFYRTRKNSIRVQE